jgi:outer membrane protein assembly factor BamB
MNNKHLYIFSKGRVAKVKKIDGEIIWETKLKLGGLINSAAVANMQIDGNKIYIGLQGNLICLNEFDGSVVWTNQLKGWGYGFVIFANQDQTNAEATNITAATTAAIGATT